ncbi:transcription factor PRE3-like [Andrographis paniculata]|uniref:transcription factor PRE3-like n=1 Tax=Andrographis paniculata TaxID=175694 RepID=UPI0021E890F9|nr:transcription factor PRE3-like [Andrographis paniculata]
MSNRRSLSSSSSPSSSSPSSYSSRLTKQEINDLILKLQPFLPNLGSSYNGIRESSESECAESAWKVLRETCNYIEKLQKEVDGLSERLSQLLASGNITAIEDEEITTFTTLLYSSEPPHPTPPHPPTEQ